MARAAVCPLCGRAQAAAFAPFCSLRCKEVDLHRWLSGTYAVPGEEIPGDEENPDAEEEI